MHFRIPKQATLIEVGPRDGFQFEAQTIPTALKLETIRNLVAAGLHQIQVASFVHPGRVPQMADAEEVVAGLKPRAGVAYSGLVLNFRGLERAVAAGLTHVEISASASDAHSRRNTGMSRRRAFDGALQMVRKAKDAGMQVRGSIQCVFGHRHPGDIPVGRAVAMARDLMDLGIDMLVLADTTGMASPLDVARELAHLSPERMEIPVVLHLHDTRGLGLTNVLTALDCGVTHFDTALAGMGGCPFIPRAAGNIATEDTAHLMQRLGIDTGVDIDQVVQCSLALGRFLNKSFSGKLYRM